MRPAVAALDPLADLRRDMIVWAEPVIADRISEGYEGRVTGQAFRSLLATNHRRLWRALILAKHDTAEQVRVDLLHDLGRAGISPDLAEEIDNDVMEELMDIVFQRFRSSREVARGFGRVLLSAASSIGATRPLAA
jgi:hypothetical protein